MIRVYNWNETEFSGNGLAALLKAKDVCVGRKLNGDCTLSLKLPVGDENWQYVAEENILTLEGQQYRIKNITDREITAYPIYQDACNKHIQSTGDMIGWATSDILAALFTGTGIELLNDAELSLLGLEKVDDAIDFFEQSKVTPIGALKVLQKQLEDNGIHNELYFDNKKIALVRSLGKERGAKIDLRLNASEIKVTRDTTEMITRLYPYGAADLHIGSVNDEKQYIESDNIKEDAQRVPVIEGFMTFDDIDDPQKLLEKAQRQFAEDNPDRIDVPKYTVEVSVLSLAGSVPIALGDVVEVNDPQYNIKTKQRVVEETYYPFEPSRSTVTVGHVAQNLMEMFSGVVSQTQSMTNSKGEVKANWLENLKRSYRTIINKALGNATLHRYGDIWVNPEDESMAMAIVNGVFAIANKKDKSGDWQWNTFGTGDGFTADAINAGKIKTANVQIVNDEDEKLSISGTLIKMTDNNNKERLILGLQNGLYSFVLNNAAEENVLKIDDDGNITMKGVLDTRKESQDAVGYIISGHNIFGQKYSGNEYIPHGLEVSENDYGNHLTLNVNGTEHLHLHAVKVDSNWNPTTAETGKRSIRYCVNNTGTAKDDKGNLFDSFIVFESIEGDTCASTKAYGKWDFSSAEVTGLNNGRTASGTLVLASKAAYSPNVKLTIQNGLIVSIEPVV